MKQRSIYTRAAATAATVILALSLADSAQAASNDGSEAPETFGGYTEAEFVEAAGNFGVPANVAHDAWADETLMRQIPVASETGGGRTEPESDALVVGRAVTAAVPKNYSGACWYKNYNALGNTITELRIDKTWNATGSTINYFNTVVSTGQAWGWSFNGLTLTQDYYQTAYENPRGIHISNRQGRFTWGADGDSVNINVTLKSKLLGVYDCLF